jgi:hypothetical protein
MQKTKALIRLLDTDEPTLYELGALLGVARRDAGFDVHTERRQIILSFLRYSVLFLFNRVLN